MSEHQAVRAFVDHPVTDLVAAERAARVAAQAWRLSAPVLRRAGMNVIFTCGDVVLRVGEPSTDAHASIELARFLQRRDLRVPSAARPDVVVSDGMSVTAWDLIETSDDPIDWVAVGEMVRRVHEVPASTLPPAVPLPRPDDFPWWNFEELLDTTAAAIDGEARRGLEAAISRHGDWRAFTERVVCHGDVHPGNVMMSHDGPVLIDWDLLCWAPPGWDHGPMMTWWSRWGGSAGAYEDFAAGYGRSMVGDPAANAYAELRLVAATLMRVRAGMRDSTAMPEAQARLRYWRGDPEAPAWRAQ